MRQSKLTVKDRLHSDEVFNLYKDYITQLNGVVLKGKFTLSGDSFNNWLNAVRKDIIQKHISKSGVLMADGGSQWDLE